ncbi:hypothetical protein BD408DRAFT_434698 [Parasitella parasitica]|nr:hypothetical protein BD408DRAFT_434698 [Parasitella parasitica]
MKFKKRQLEYYVAGSTIINPPASFLKPSNGLRSKVQTSKEKTDYWNALQLEKNGDYDELCISLLRNIRILKGVVQEAEAKIKKFVEKNFQSLLVLPEKDDGSNDDKDSEDSKDEDNDGATQDDAEQFCACSISLSQVLRDDLKDDIRSLFINTIGATMEQVSNNTSDFSKQVLKVALLFAEYTFESNAGNIELVYDGGNSIAPILPEGYLEEDTPFNYVWHTNTN